MSVQKEKLQLERDYLVTEYKNLDRRLQELLAKYNDQARLLASVVSHVKSPGTTLNQLDASVSADGATLSNEEKAKEESIRNNRIARQMNRSSFMHLGENPPKLMSEQDPTQQARSLAGPGQGGVNGINS